MGTEIDEAISRTRSYWYRDGLGEIGVGALFALMGALFLVEALAGPRSIIGAIAAVSFPILAIGGQFALSRLIIRAKERFTYPRTGYVACARPDPRRKRTGAAVAVVAAALIATLLASGRTTGRGWTVVQGMIAGGILLATAVTAGIARLYVEAALMLLCGVALSAAGVGQLAGSGLFFGLAGAIMMAGGGWTFRQYLRTSPPAPAGGDA